MPSNERKDFETVDLVLRKIAGWVTRYRETCAVQQLDECGASEVERIASDMGLSPSQLRDLTRKGPRAANQLTALLLGLGIDPWQAVHEEAALMRDMQRLCATCVQKKQCARELVDGLAVETYHEFCPNALTIDALLSVLGRIPENIKESGYGH